MKATDSQLCKRWLWRFRFLMLVIIITISGTLLCCVPIRSDPIRAVSRSFLAKKKKKKKKKTTREAETTIFSTGTNKMFPTGKLHLLKKFLSGTSICSIILKAADMMIPDFMLFSLKSFCIFCSWHLRICALGNQGLAFLLLLLLLPGLASRVFHSLISIQEFVFVCWWWLLLWICLMYWDDTDGIKSNCCDRAGHQGSGIAHGKAKSVHMWYVLKEWWSWSPSACESSPQTCSVFT